VLAIYLLLGSGVGFFYGATSGVADILLSFSQIDAPAPEELTRQFDEGWSIDT
jgi:hypothetical protein